MKKKQFHRLFSAIMAFAMVFTLLAPMTASASNSPNPFKQNGTNESIMQAKAAIAQQLNVLEGEPALHKDLQGLSGSEEVSVIIHLSEKPVALEKGIKELAGQKFTSSEANAVKSKVSAQHTFFKKEMNANQISFTEDYSYSTVLNGIAATVKADDLKKLLDIQGVVLVEPVVEVHAFESTLTPDGTVDAAMNTSLPFLGIERIWDKGFKGKGIKVAVLDTGIDYLHPEFEGIYKGGWNFIPNNADYTRPRADNDPYETTPTERPSNKPEFDDRGSAFYTSHGTHVAGTIAALGKNEYGIAGIAPEIDLYAYRVLGAYGSGSNAGVISGINKAVEEGMDIINLSLGGGTNTSTTSDTIAINNAMLAGTLAVMATGNSGPGRGTIGTPGAAALGLAVGNTTNPEANYDADVTVKAGSYSKTSNIKLMGTTFGVNLATQLAGEFDIVAVPKIGSPSDYNGLDVAGKFVLVSRGDIAFVDKIAAAKDAGAVGMLIHNFAGGTNAPNPSGTTLGDDFEFLPTFDMSQTEGDALRAALGSNSGKVSFANIGKTMTVGDEVNSSSSRGPTTPHFDIKPDVSAPGTNIMSTIPMYGKEDPEADYSKAFSRKTGTSMATPHVAGIAALVMNANPNWNVFDVKVAISNTAKVLDTTKYDVFAQGPGRVQPYEAAFPKALAYAEDTVVTDGEEVDNIKGTVTFGNLEKVKDEAVSVTKQVRVKNLSGNASDYTVSVQVTKVFGDATVTVDKSNFSLNDEQLLNITLSSPKSATKAGDELLGYIHITNGETNLSLPFAADFSPSLADYGITEFKTNDTDLSFNGDGIKDSAKISFTLADVFGDHWIEVWDIMDPDGGYYRDGYLGYIYADSIIFPGSYTLDFKGAYKPWNPSAPVATLPDGLYTFDFWGENLTGPEPESNAWIGPMFVKSSPATIESEEEQVADDTTYEFSGQIVDKYIEWQEELYYYDLGYNLNTKLATTFEARDEAGNVVSSGPVNLAQNGSFTVNVTGLADGVNTVTIFVKDAAGNNAQETFNVAYEAPEVEPVLGLSVSPANLSLKVGDSEQLQVIVTEIVEDEAGTESVDNGTIEEGTETDSDDEGTEEVTEPESDEDETGEGTEPVFEDNKMIVASAEVEAGDDGTETESVNSVTVEEGTEPEEGTDEDEVEVVDVTAEATYSSDNENVATVSETGLVTAVSAGNASITVLYDGMEATVEVVVNPVVTLSVDKTNLSIEKGKTAAVKVTETTKTAIEGDPTDVDVTTDAQYAVANNSIVTVANGVITANATGSTTFTITYGEHDPITVNVTVTEPTPENPGNGGGGGNNGGGGGGGYFPSTPTTPTPTTPTKPDPVKPDPVKPEPVKPVKFTDVTGHWAELYIQKAVQFGLFKGYDDGTFKPNNELTRAQAVSLIVRALDLETDEAAPFNDIGKYAEETQAEIAAAYKYGIVKGSNGSFKPADKVTRAQIALMIARAYEYKIGVAYTPMAIAPFSDYGNYNEETVNAISMLYELKIVTGFEGKFMPQDPTTRAQAAKMFVNIMEKLQ